MMENDRTRRESRDEAARRIVGDLNHAYGGRIRHHVARNSNDTPRYIVIDIGQNQRQIPIRYDEEGRIT